MSTFPAKDSVLNKLIYTLPKSGIVTWIGIRPARRAPVQHVLETTALAGRGLTGDHFKGSLSSTRQVTLIQAEHLIAVASFLGLDTLDPALVRRNIAVQGINLLALKDKQFQIGEAIFEMTGQCHPCSRMEEVLGEGGYNAMRNHGGITARILKDGIIRVGDTVQVVSPD